MWKRQRDLVTGELPGLSLVGNIEDWGGGVVVTGSSVVEGGVEGSGSGSGAGSSIEGGLITGAVDDSGSGIEETIVGDETSGGEADGGVGDVGREGAVGIDDDGGSVSVLDEGFALTSWTGSGICKVGWRRRPSMRTADCNTRRPWW